MSTRFGLRGWLLRQGLPGLAVALALWRSLVAVDETQFVLVTQFGRHVATLRDPGLHLILPYQSITRFDRRLQIYNPRPSEFLTRDPKNILLDLYVCWRVSDPLLFLQRVTDAAGAEARLHDIVWAEAAAEVGRRQLTDLVSDKDGEMQMPVVVEEIRRRCAEHVGDMLGIELVDVRLRRLNLPEQNKQSVFDRMRAERERTAKLYRAEGEEEALKIRAEADREKSRLLTEAQRDAELRRGEAENEAIRIYSAAHGKAPEFYRFLRSLDLYRKILTEKSTLMLSADSEVFRYLGTPDPAGVATEPPRPGPAVQAAKAAEAPLPNLPK